MRGFVFALVAWALGLWVFGIASASGRRWAGAPPFEAWAQLRSIRRRLTPHAAEQMGRFFYEGRLFSYSFYGFALVNMATALPQGDPFRRKAVTELERVLPIVEELGAIAPFDMCDELQPKGGVIAAGNANLLRAGYALLGGAREKVLRDFHDTSALFHGEFLNARFAILPSYPEMLWPVDNCCALESLRLHDVLYQTSYSAARRNFADWVAKHLDPATSMMVAQIGVMGQTAEGPRGCALSWTLAFLPALAPELAREQYRRYRDEWFVQVHGLTGIREWPPGRSGMIDPDTGPVVWGIGAAASGFGIAAAKANADWTNLRGMLRAMELAGFPAWTAHGEKRYFAGRVLLADVLALWGKTLRPWDKPPGNTPLASPWPEPRQPGFWLVLAATGALAALLLGLALWELVRAWRRFRSGPGWRGAARLSRLLFVCECAVLAAWLAIPAITWIVAFALLIVLDLVDHLGQRRPFNVSAG